MKYALIFVEAADYHSAVCHGPFDSAASARAYRELAWPSYEPDDETLGEEWWDGDNCVVLTSLTSPWVTS